LAAFSSGKDSWVRRTVALFRRKWRRTRSRLARAADHAQGLQVAMAKGSLSVDSRLARAQPAAHALFDVLCDLASDLLDIVAIFVAIRFLPQAIPLDVDSAQDVLLLVAVLALSVWGFLSEDNSEPHDLQ